MLFANYRSRFQLLASRQIAILMACALILSLCGVLISLPFVPAPKAHASSVGPLVTAINAGGGTTGNFVADTNYNTGNAYSDTSTSINTAGVSNPAPQAVWQTCRWNSSFTYTI